MQVFDWLKRTADWWTKRRKLAYYNKVIDRQKFPKDIRQILVVCKGNICRSPLAEAYLKMKFRESGREITVESAGLETTIGKPAHPYA